MDCEIYSDTFRKIHLWFDIGSITSRLVPRRLGGCGWRWSAVRSDSGMSGSVAFGVVCHAAYILGFPADTPQTIAEDVEALKEIGFDHVSFFILTPLPGSEDHIRQHVAGVPMDGDLNQYPELAGLRSSS